MARRRGAELDFSAVIEEIGLEGLIQQAGFRRVIDTIGPKRVVEEIGIDALLAQLSPEQKEELKRRLQEGENGNHG